MVAVTSTTVFVTWVKWSVKLYMMFYITYSNISIIKDWWSKYCMWNVDYITNFNHIVLVTTSCPNRSFFFPGCFPHRPLRSSGSDWYREGISQFHEAPNPPTFPAVGVGRLSPGCQAGIEMEGPEEGEAEVGWGESSYSQFWIFTFVLHQKKILIKY